MAAADATPKDAPVMASQPSPSRLPEILFAFLRLGLTSFGGPVAHLGYFRHEFVARRRWLDDLAYADLVALCQFLPGPASSQVGMALGLHRGGIIGAFAAWLAFTLPSAALLVAFALALTRLDPATAAPWLRGLQGAAAAVVAQAVWSMGRILAPDLPRIALALFAAAGATLLPGAAGQVAVLAAGGLAGRWLLPPPPAPAVAVAVAVAAATSAPSASSANPATSTDHPIDSTAPSALHVPLRRRTGLLLLALLGTLLLLLPLLARHLDSHVLRMFEGYFRSGALVFGGGHVVLPLLEAQVVPSGWVSRDTFLAGYGAAQVVPGPLFTFAAYLGAASTLPPHGIPGAALALAAIFLPSFLLVLGALPVWASLRSLGPMQRALRGINASVVGLLLAALLGPVRAHGIQGPADLALSAACLLALMAFKAPAWLVVPLAALAAGLGWHS
jgi:chromate transporter